MEMPIMGVVIAIAARWIVRRPAVPPSPARRLAMGGVALALLLAAEFTLVLRIRGLSIGEYVTSLDPVSGTVYGLLLGALGLMPRLVARNAGARNVGDHAHRARP